MKSKTPMGGPGWCPYNPTLRTENVSPRGLISCLDTPLVDSSMIKSSIVTFSGEDITTKGSLSSFKGPV